MTYKELKAELETLNEEQLSQTVRTCGLDRNGSLVDFDILEEDYVNPSGDGMEPISLYQTIDDDADNYMDCDEPIVARKGDVFLFETE